MSGLNILRSHPSHLMPLGFLEEWIEARIGGELELRENQCSSSEPPWKLGLLGCQPFPGSHGCFMIVVPTEYHDIFYIYSSIDWFFREKLQEHPIEIMGTSMVSA